MPKDVKEKKAVNLADMSQDEILAYVASLEGKNAQLNDVNSKLEKDLAKKNKKAEEPEQPDMTTEQWLEEKVPFQAFKDNDKYKDDIVVKINGERLQIPRGKMFMIKRKFYLALSDAERQNNLAADVQTDYESEFETNVKGRM